MNPPKTLTQFSDKQLLEQASDARESNNTHLEAALIDVVKLRRKVLELKAQLRRK
jgi:hypothetical protein